MQKILVVEDEPEMIRGLKDILEFEGYEVLGAESGTQALHALEKQVPDCIILDIMLPDMTGYQVCAEIRGRNVTTPILMLTAKAQDYDKIRGFEVGADDYLTKPFSVGELLARVMALLRRSGHYANAVDLMRIGTSEVDVRHFRVRRGKKDYSLSHYEVELLKLLYINAGKPVTRDEILNKVWGTDNYPTNRTVDNFIVKLRKKIEDNYKNPKHILTIYGIGYQLSP
jgi:DNA-binding response OmpR family regulator